MMRMLSLLALALLAGACSRTPPPEPVEVSGKLVDARGKGVPGKLLTFLPADESNKRGPRREAATSPDGSFSVKGGLWPGKHTVSAGPIPTGTGGTAGGSPGVHVEAKEGEIRLPPQEVEIPANGTAGLVITIK